jgi:hypothetical protein
VYIDVNAGNEVTVTMLQLGYPTTEHYIMVQNENNLYQGNWEIVLL